MERFLNVHFFINNQIERMQRLGEAQKIHLMAYRGAPYWEVPRQEHVGTDLNDRGQSYLVQR